jgi:hypothetical protein
MSAEIRVEKMHPPFDLPPIFGGNVPLAQIALGLLLGLLGWPIYAAAVRLAGALIGIAVGLAIVLVVNALRPLEEMLIPTLVIVAVVGALLGVWLIRRLVPIVWLLMGASLGILGVWTARGRLANFGVAEWAPAAQVALWAGAALIVGILTVWLRRWLVIVVTAALGAALLAPHLAVLGPPPLAWWSAGTAGFIAVQAGVHRLVGLDQEEEEEAESDDD